MTEVHDIVPEDFDLNAALHARTSTPDDEQPRCPECNSFNISRKSGGPFGDGKRHDGKYRCLNDRCRHHFDEPERGGDE